MLSPVALRWCLLRTQVSGGPCGSLRRDRRQGQTCGSLGRDRRWGQGQTMLPRAAPMLLGCSQAKLSHVPQ